jgi:hypothetical protein
LYMAGPKLWADFNALIGIFNQSVGPSLAIWTNPAQFSLDGVAVARPPAGDCVSRGSSTAIQKPANSVVTAEARGVGRTGGARVAGARATIMPRGSSASVASQGPA